jgi:glycosyltransferase involved in cell wall biosynthesis
MNKVQIRPCEAEVHTSNVNPRARFSILIPTWNNIDFIKLCVASIRKNSGCQHEVILHINDGSDGTVEWARSEGLAFTRSRSNIGICHAVNIARTLAHTDYIVYMNDDMYVCPGWDDALLEEAEKIGHPRFMLSATMFEPHPTNSAPVIAPRNYGTTVQDFDEERLLREYQTPDWRDWSGSTRPPTLVHRYMWDLVGGYSTEFSPGSYSDPDFSMKLWKAGVRHFCGVGRSRVYHFTSKSVSRVRMNDGRKQFLRKWGITSSTLERHLLRVGKPFNGPLPDEPDDSAYRLALLKNKLQRVFIR